MFVRFWEEGGGCRWWDCILYVCEWSCYCVDKIAITINQMPTILSIPSQYNTFLSPHIRDWVLSDWAKLYLFTFFFPCPIQNLVVSGKEFINRQWVSVGGQLWRPASLSMWFPLTNHPQPAMTCYCWILPHSDINLVRQKSKFTECESFACPLQSPMAVFNRFWMTAPTIREGNNFKRVVWCYGRLGKTSQGNINSIFQSANSPGEN